MPGLQKLPIWAHRNIHTYAHYLAQCQSFENFWQFLFYGHSSPTAPKITVMCKQCQSFAMLPSPILWLCFKATNYRKNKHCCTANLRASAQKGCSCGVTVSCCSLYYVFLAWVVQLASVHNSKIACHCHLESTGIKSVWSFSILNPTQSCFKWSCSLPTLNQSLPVQCYFSLFWEHSACCNSFLTTEQELPDSILVLNLDLGTWPNPAPLTCCCHKEGSENSCSGNLYFSCILPAEPATVMFQTAECSSQQCRQISEI